MAIALSTANRYGKTSAGQSSTERALERIDTEHGVEYARERFSRTLRGERPGLRIESAFCPDDGQSPFATAEWEPRSATIKDESGAALFEQNDCEVPASWSQLATNVVVSKYFYGDPKNVAERERSVRQLIHRVTRTITDWGLADGYFDTAEDGDRFYRDLTWLCLHQHGAFNSPVWFNVGLHAQYGIEGAKCNWRWDAAAGESVQPENPYEHPQASACFIQSVDDNMEDIMRLACSEAMLFKFGSGRAPTCRRSAANREKLSGGGTPSGPLSFMRVYDSDRRGDQERRQDAAGRQDAIAQGLAPRHPGIHRVQMVEERKGPRVDPPGLRVLQRRSLQLASVPERQPLGPRDRRLSWGGSRRPPLETRWVTDKSARHGPAGIRRERTAGPDGRGALALRRPGCPVRHDDQPLAHLSR